MHVRVYGTVGIVNGIVVETSGSTLVRRTLFTDVFAYRDGKWQAVNAQELPSVEERVQSIFGMSLWVSRTYFKTLRKVIMKQAI